MNLYKSKGRKIFNIVNIILLIIISMTCVLPFIHLLAVSFSSATAVSAGKVGFLPIDFNVASYEFALTGGRFIHSMLISFERVILGVGINLVLMILTAYPLSKTKKQVAGRNIYMVFFMITMLVSGGMIPTYLVVTSLGLKDTIWALVLPGALPVYNMIVLMNFMRELPEEMEEAAAIPPGSPLRSFCQQLLHS